MAQNQQAQLPDVETAFATLFDNVHQQVFFHKLASYGIAPQNEEQQAAMLESAFRLRYLEEQEAYKQASDNSSVDPFVAANNYLASLVGEDQQGMSKAAEEEAISNMAAQLMQRPEFYNSVLSIKAKQAADTARGNY